MKDIISDKELIEFLELDFEFDEGVEYEHRKTHTIQVCAGSWKRIDADTWYFERDPEWDA